MSRNIVETVMGGVVLVIAVVFLVFGYRAAAIRSAGGYIVTAKFDHIDGVRDGGDVRIGGIKIGTIVSETLDDQSYQAIVKMAIDDNIKLPVDTLASISSTGLLGDKFMALLPGNSDEVIKPNGLIKNTQSPASLEELLGKFVYNMQQTPAKPAEAPAAPAK